MWGSYGSYSSMSSISAPIDIRPTSTRCFDSVESHYAHRSSFSSSEEDRPTSFLSDDDLFPCDTFEDDARSIASSSSGVWSAGCSPRDDGELLRAMEREREAKLQRDLEMKLQAKKLNAEKERRQAQQLMRQQAMLASRKRKSSSNKSPKPKLVAISE
jgi:hypothetical protein